MCHRTGVDGVPRELLKYSAAAITYQWADAYPKSSSDIWMWHRTRQRTTDIYHSLNQVNILVHSPTYDQWHYWMQATYVCPWLLPKVDIFLYPSQSGFKKGRSTSDMVWCKRYGWQPKPKDSTGNATFWGWTCFKPSSLQREASANGVYDCPLWWFTNFRCQCTIQD